MTHARAAIDSSQASHRHGVLPMVVRVSDAGIFTFRDEELTIEDVPATVGAAVCVRSGSRLAFRRVLGIDGKVLRLRADLAPFEDRWDSDIVGCVRPRPIDRVAAIDAERFTRINWQTSIAASQLKAAYRGLYPKRRVDFRTEELKASDWPRVRAFWFRACGRELPVQAHPQQHVIGLFFGAELVGANIHLAVGSTSYSAFTLVDRRFRGTGGGTKMIQRAVQVCRRQGLQSIYVHIDVRNFPSIAAYERSGFEKKGWWSDESDPLASAERRWNVLELDLTKPR